ncbi:MAG: hypothetical protein IPN94_12135 [Sphingobacteriales bacterium]|nr:hypothetical protein [Sphingobacteriales bacterium]
MVSTSLTTPAKTLRLPRRDFTHSRQTHSKSQHLGSPKRPRCFYRPPIALLSLGSTVYADEQNQKVIAPN